MMVLPGGWLGLALLATCSRGDTSHAALASRPGEALAYEVELGAASVGSWQTRVTEPVAGQVTLRAELSVDPLLATFLPARGRMQVELSPGGGGPRQARMMLARGEVRQETRWLFAASPAGATAEVTVHRGPDAAAATTRQTLSHPTALFDPLSTFFLLRQRAGARHICILVATGTGPWWLELTWLDSGSHKTSAGYRPSHHYALTYQPRHAAQAGHLMRGELWMAARGDGHVYEVSISEPHPVRARLAAYEAGASATP